MEYLAIFSSVNLVNQLKGRLKQEGRYFGMIRAPHGLSPGGCGFALRFSEKDLLLIRRAVEELKIPLNGIYREADRENGTKSYLSLE